MIDVYGIPNCNTVKKSLDWLRQNKIEFTFHDFKKEGVTQKKLKEWVKVFGWEKVLNKKGTTWRTLGPEVQQEITTQTGAIGLMMEKSSVIKRPVIEANGKYLLGFDEKEYEAVLL
jgi:arsenate reductase (glutaredoxin)